MVIFFTSFCYVKIEHLRLLVTFFLLCEDNKEQRNRGVLNQLLMIFLNIEIKYKIGLRLYLITSRDD
jgi:hypothetical protein